MVEFEYRCTDCGTAYGRDAVRYLCPSCGQKYRPGEPLPGVLEAVFDYGAIRRRFDRARPDWSLFSPVETRHYPEYPVGQTPLSAASRLGGRLGFQNLWLKNDGLNPSGSLKDRASFLVVAEANRLGERRIVTASTGNAASALAAVCAAAGREAVIFVPLTAPRAKLVQMVLYGARVLPVDGTYDDAFQMSLAYTRERGGLNRNTAYHPLTIEGKKTVALEIFAQCGFQAPDAVVVSAGDGVILAGVWKGFADLLRAGLIPRLPRLVAVQAETSDAIHRLVATGAYHAAPAPRTIADSISVSAPSNAWMAARAVRESAGFSLTVSDEEIRQAQRLLASTSGIFAEPAAAAAVAGLARTNPAQLDRAARIVVLVTGHGLKDIEAAQQGWDLPAPLPPGSLPAD